MSARQGKCTNFGNCAIADTRQVVDIRDGLPFTCPDCRRALTEMNSREGLSRTQSLAIAGVVLVGVTVVAAWLVARTRPVAERADSSKLAAGDVVLKLHGSNTIGAELGPALAVAFFRKQGAANVHISPAGADAVRVEGALPGSTEPQVIQVEAHGSATAFTDLAADKCDIGMASRPIKKDELTKLSALGDMTSPAAEHVLALDGVVVIVNKANPLSALSLQQIAKVFSGEISDWSEIGAPAGTIGVYARDDKSGTFDTFKALVLGSRTLTKSAVRFEDTRALSDRVSGDIHGIGFVGLPYIRSAKALAVSDLGTEPRLPSVFTIATEDYLLSRRLFLYTPPNARKPLANRFVEFALSKDGQDVVSSSGFVSQNVRPGVEPLGDADRQSEYGRTVQGSKRMSLNFRFRSGSPALDNKALVDLDRMVSFLSDLKYTGDRILLLGFADSTGSPAANVTLSKDRAQAVEEQFAIRGIKPAVVTGLGSEKPVASNESEEGRQRNRRVEVWLRDR